MNYSYNEGKNGIPGNGNSENANGISVNGMNGNSMNSNSMNGNSMNSNGLNGNNASGSYGYQYGSNYLGPNNFIRNVGYQGSAQNTGSNTNYNSNANNISKNTKTEKKSGFAKKFFSACAIGIGFGLFAAIGFFATMEIGKATGLIDNTDYYGAGIKDNSDSDLASDTLGMDIDNPSVDSDDSNSLTGTNEPDGVVQSDTSSLLNATYKANVVNDVSGVVEECMPSIVSITTVIEYNYYYYTNEAVGKGSGIIVGQNDDELLIATNYHVIEDNKSITVTFCDNEEVEAFVKGTYEELDLAVVAVDLYNIPKSTQDKIKIAQIGDSDSLKVGEPVIAIGNALGYGQSVTTGVVSALNCEMDFAGNGKTSLFIQTDAAINQGNSGGALLNIAGQVIGINSNKLGGSAVEGMGYAIPMSVAKPVIESLMQKETRKVVDEDEQGCLGISGVSVTPQEQAFYNYPSGVYVANVFENSAADKGGIKTGDFLYEFNGEPISSMEQLKSLLQYYSIGEKVTMKGYRASDDEYVQIEYSITLGDKDDLEY